jgi:3-oxoadipate enol-lactonase
LKRNAVLQPESHQDSNITQILDGLIINPMNASESSVMSLVNNTAVSYIDEGPAEGRVVIFIHGFPLNKSMWEKQIEALQDEFRVIAYDIRGHGDSEAGNAHFSMDLFVNDLIGFMQSLNIEKAVLCGLSMGGYIALNAAINFPEHFDALILSDTSCTADSPKSRNKRIEAIESIRLNGLENFADESIKNLFASGSVDAKGAEIAAAREMIVNTSSQSVYNSMHALAVRKETCSRLSEIKIPVLILVGDEDKITPPIAAMVMHQNIRGSAFSIIEKAGHLSNMENPYEFNYLVKKFLATVY